MQDRYAGDIGDFGKFGLLRHLVSNTHWRLGVVWYLFPNENHNEDGKYTSYLSDLKYEQCDKKLFQRLKKMVDSRERTVKALENAAILPEKTKFFSRCVNFNPDAPGNSEAHKAKRNTARKDWLDAALRQVANCNVVFLDPDNGLQIESCPVKSRRNAGKFVFFDEAKEFFCRPELKVLVIYHHLNRHKKHGTHPQQIKKRAEELIDKLQPGGGVIGIRYRPFSPRAYFLVTKSKEGFEQVRNALAKFLEGSWGCGDVLGYSFFEWVYPTA